MLSIYLVMFSPVIVGVVGSIALRFAWRRNLAPLTSRLRWLALGAGLLPVLVVTFDITMAAIPSIISARAAAAFWDTRFFVPLAAGVLAVGLLAIPDRPTASPDHPLSAEVARRTAFTYLPRGWIVTPVALLAITLATSLAAGIVSSPDDAGRYAQYTVEVGTSSFGTTIYGWYFSLPALALLVLLVGVAWAALAHIASRPLTVPQDQDGAVRRTRSRNVAALTSGILALNLSQVLGSLAGTLSLRGGLQTGTTGEIVVQVPFAALAPVMSVTSFALACAGIALCLAVSLTAIRVPSRTRQATVTA